MWLLLEGVLASSFHYDRVLVTPNTVAGHRMLWWAEQRKQQDHLAEALFHAYFTEGRDIGRHDVLAKVASEVGLPEDEARAFLDGDGGRKEVALEEMAGRSLGLDWVPFFVINGTPAFSGAQNPETFLKAFQYVLGGNTGQSGADSREVQTLNNPNSTGDE
jgi:predicted DsbA family dithiol-disulfide isomerase